MNTTDKLAAALRECRDDTNEAINLHIQAYGENYRPHRLAALRKALADADEALALFDTERQQAAGAAQPGLDERMASNPYAHSKNHASVWEAGYDAGRRASLQQPAPEASNDDLRHERMGACLRK